jgi:hypothetical protein
MVSCSMPIHIDHVSVVTLFVKDPDARCCDNCHPDLFSIDTILIKYPFPTHARQAPKPSLELQSAVINALRSWQMATVERDYPGQQIITSRYLLNDDIIDKIAAWPRAIDTVDVFQHIIPWRVGVELPYGTEVIKVVKDEVAKYPDPQEAARQEAAYEWLNAMAEKQKQEALLKVFHECYEAVYSTQTGIMIKRGRGSAARIEPERKCQAFLALPQKTVSLSFIIRI